MTENFLKLRKKMGIQIQETQNTPTKMTLKSSTPICIIIKLSKVKEKCLKNSREKLLTMYKRAPMSNKLDNLEEMGKFLETYNLQRLNHKEIKKSEQTYN